MATRIASRSPSGGRQWRLSAAGRFALVHTGTMRDASPPTRKARAIIAFLCLHPGERFTRERIATLLWGDRGEAQARASLRQALLEIRHATADGPRLLQSDREHVWAEPASLEPEALDETSWARSDELLFDDLSNLSPDFDEWLAVARADRSRRLADALRKEVEKLLGRDRGVAALPLVDRLHRLDPFDEDALRLALRAEYQAGRIAGIERRMREMDSRLQDELGVSVSNESKTLRDELVEALSTSVARPKLPQSVLPLKGKGNALEAPAKQEPKRRVGFVGAKRLWAAVATAVALLVIAAFFLVGRTAKVPPSALTVALLPFTADPSDADARKLAVATREAVAHAVSQGRFSVSTIDAAPRSDRAPADFLISGQATGTPDKVVVSVRMEETAHHLVVGSDQFEATREKAWDLPERVGAQVAMGLSWIAPLLALEQRHPSDPAIITSLLRSGSALDSVSDLHDYEEARRLAAKAPNSPLAQYNLAFTTPWVLYALPREDRAEAVTAARRAADRTLKLAPEFGGAYLPWCLLHSEQRRIQCEDRLRAGMRADPDNPLNSWFLSRLLNQVGRNQEAAELAALSLAHDQYMPLKIGHMLRMLEVTGKTEEAGEIYQRAARWWPGDHDIFWWRLSGMLMRGDFEAAQRFERETAGDGHRTFRPIVPLVSPLRSNSVDRAGIACAHVKPEPNFDEGQTIQCMFGLARLGDLDGAYRFVDGIYPSRRGRTPAEEERIWLDNPDAVSVVFLTGPAAAPLRRDPRYMALAERVGLLEYWRSGRPPDFCRKDSEPICAQLRKGRGPTR